MNAPSESRGLRGLGVGVSVLATLAGLVASAILLVDYLRPTAVFCNEASAGCAQLRTTSFAAWAGIPTPYFGIFGFLLLGTLALIRGPKGRLAYLAATASAGVFAAFLLVVQARLGVFCRFCVVVDTAALVLLAAGLLRWRLADGPAPLPRWTTPAFVAAMVMATAIPLGIGFTRPLPAREATSEGPEVTWEVVVREMAATPKGQVTVVDFVDFECPFCRMTHEAIAPVLQKHAARVRVVRKQVPLRSIHVHAMDAARAACCGEKLGKGDAMAEALFSAPGDDLTPAGCEKIAASIGLDAAAFGACFKDPAIEARIEREIAEFKSSGGRGLPTIWIDDKKFVGAQDAETLEQAIVQALRGKS